MGWDGIFKKNFRPLERDECQNFPSHPVPWDVFKQICVPWDQWDGTGRSRPVPRGPLMYMNYNLKTIHKIKHMWWVSVEFS